MARGVQAAQELTSLHAEQVRHRAAMPEREQLGVDAVLQRAAFANQEQPSARAFALLALLKGRQPDRRYEITARQLGQHPRVDTIGLARQRREPP
jgi:hypothetical protein